MESSLEDFPEFSFFDSLKAVCHLASKENTPAIGKIQTDDAAAHWYSLADERVDRFVENDSENGIHGNCPGRQANHDLPQLIRSVRV